MWNVFNRTKAPLAKRAEVFWQWFAKNESTLSNYASDSKSAERAISLVAKELNKVHPLAFEFGGGSGDKLDFTISADGMKKDFPTVAALCKAAPQLPRWNIVAFRQRKEESGGVIHTHGVSVNIDECAFSAERTEEGMVDLVLYMKGLTQDTYEAYGSAGFLILDSMLGEFDVTTKVGAIEFEVLTDETMREKKLTPLRELRRIFDGMQTTSPSTKNVGGDWSGYYHYAADAKQFHFKAQLKLTDGYLEGTMDDNSDLGEASISGLIRDSIIVFQKTYDRSDLDPVIYHGRIESDGKSMSGKWQLEGQLQSLEGVWFMQHEP